MAGDTTGLRSAVERRSRPLLLRLARQPRALIPTVAAALFLGVVSLPGVAAGLCLVVLFGFLAWLAYLAWPALGAGGRAGRVLTLLILLGLGALALTY